MKIVSIIEMTTSSGETTLGYRNHHGHVVQIKGPKKEISETFYGLLSSEFEKGEQDATH